MSEQGWWSLFAAAFSGAGSFAAIELIYKEFKDWRGRRRDQLRNIDASLEPLLRATDGLAGKLRSLAERDFLPVRGKNDYSLADMEVASIVYLFVQFWAEVEIVRFRSLSGCSKRSIDRSLACTFDDCSWWIGRTGTAAANAAILRRAPRADRHA